MQWMRDLNGSSVSTPAKCLRSEKNVCCLPVNLSLVCQEETFSPQQKTQHKAGSVFTALVLVLNSVSSYGDSRGRSMLGWLARGRHYENGDWFTRIEMWRYLGCSAASMPHPPMFRYCLDQHYPYQGCSCDRAKCGQYSKGTGCPKKS